MPMLTSEKKRKQKQKKIRHMEYYNLVDVFDKLYTDSKDGKVFTGLMEIITSEENIKLAYRNIKRNTGSNTSGVDGRTIKYLEEMPAERLIDRYLEMLPRIYEAIGHLKLSQIRPQHLNEFYMNLSKPGARADSKRATPKPIFNKRFQSLGISKQQLARESGVSPQTISAVTKGDCQSKSCQR